MTQTPRVSFFPQGKPHGFTADLGAFTLWASTTGMPGWRSHTGRVLGSLGPESLASRVHRGQPKPL